MKRTGLVLLAGSLVIAGTALAASWGWLHRSEADTAMRWRAERGDSASQLAWAQRLESRAEPSLLPDAFHWYESAGQAGQVKAMRAAARLAADPANPAASADRFRHWLQALASEGDADSRFQLGLLLMDEGESDQGLGWLRRAAEAGHPEAAWQAGQHLLAREAGTDDLREAFPYIRTAADSGVAGAMAWLGIGYGEGGLLPPDSSRSEEWLNRAAAQGHPDASYRMGKLFLERARSHSHLETARRYLEHAYASGHLQAAFPLARLALRQHRPDDAGALLAVAALAGEDAAFPRLIRLLQDQNRPRDLWLGFATLHQRRWARSSTSGQAPPNVMPGLSPIDALRGDFLADHLENLHARWQETGGDLETLIRGLLDDPPVLGGAYGVFEPLFEAAVSGDTAAILELGQRLLHGEGLVADPVAGLIRITHAADLGSGEACWVAHQVFSSADAPHADPERARDFLQRASAFDHPEALLKRSRQFLAEDSPGQDRLAMRLLHRAVGFPPAEALRDELLIADRGIDPTVGETLDALRRLAKAGHAAPMYHVANHLWGRRSQETDRTEELTWRAVDYWSRAAAQGHLKAAEYASTALRIHHRGQEDLDTARQLLEAAAEQGSARADYLLGNWILEESFDEPSFKRATALFRRAAERGDPDARFLFIDHHPTAQDEVADDGEPVIARSMVDLYHQATSLGCAVAALALGTMILDDDSLAHLVEWGLELIEESAYRGHLPAYLTMAYLYENGEHVEQDHLRSLRWLEAAADAGDPDAQFIVGMCYIEGRLVVRDLERGQALLAAAAAQDHELATLLAAGVDRIESAGMAQSSEEAIEIIFDFGASIGEIHPVRLVAAEEARVHEITHLRRGRPAAQTEAGAVVLSDSLPVFALAAEAFHPGRVKIGHVAAFWRWNWVSGRLQSDFSKAQIVTTLEAEQTLTNCHAVLLIEDPHGYYSASWRHIGTLRAGREHLLRIDVDAPNWWQRRLSLLIFSNGAEVVTTKRMQPTHLPPSEDLDFINQRSEELAAAAETGVTAPSRLVADLAPVFPGALEGERAMTAEVTVDTKGRISGVRLDSRAGQILATDILRSLARARFIPALKEGRPVESVLTVDIPFD